MLPITLPVFLGAMVQRDHMTDRLQRLYGIHDRMEDPNTAGDGLQRFIDRLRGWGYRVSDPRPYHFESDNAIVAFQAFTFCNEVGADLSSGDVMVAVNGTLYRLRR